jgi:hypothetical protein
VSLARFSAWVVHIPVHIRRGLPGTRVEPFSSLCDSRTPIAVKSYGKYAVGCPVCLILVVHNGPHSSPLCGRRGCFFSVGFSSRIPSLISGPCEPGRKSRRRLLGSQGLRSIGSSSRACLRLATPDAGCQGERSCTWCVVEPNHACRMADRAPGRRRS